MSKARSRIRRVVRIPKEYFEALDLANGAFPSFYQFENGLRLAIHKYLSSLYTDQWWELSLKSRFPRAYEYAEEQQTKRDAMPWIGASTAVPVLPIHLVTLGLLEQIVVKYRSECIPSLFPTMEFFLGHMEVIKRVRNMYAHMFPCITREDCKVAKREIATLASHINSRL
jgi:hypothetical protein